MPNTKRAEVPFGDNLTPPQRVSRMLEIIDDLLPLADLSQEGFYASDTREEATAYAAALGRAGFKLPPSFQNDHPEIDWAALEDLRRISFHDGIDVLMLRDQLQRVLPTLQAMLENFLDETPTTEPEP